jgi:flagellar FliL protein
VLVGALGLTGVAALGAVGWLLGPRLWDLRAPRREASLETAPERAVQATVPLGPVVVNLAGATGSYLRVGVHLGVRSEREAREVQAATPKILDLLITILSRSTVEALTSEDGRASLKQELLARIRDDLGLTVVRRIYFTEFVIQ